MNIAVYPGSFDILSNGHLDIIKRASKIFDKVYVLVSYNINKNNTFNKDERISLIKKCTSSLPNIIIDSYDGLVVDYCKEHNINIIIRGIRGYNDFDAEYNLATFNSNINNNIETIVLFSKNENRYISSSAIKELIKFNCDISSYVPKEIVEDVLNKYKLKG